VVMDGDRLGGILTEGRMSHSKTRGGGGQ